MRPEIKKILKVTNGWVETCSLENPKTNCLGFVRNKNAASRIRTEVENMYLVVPDEIKEWPYPSWVVPIPDPDPEFTFFLYHNEVNRDRVDEIDKIVHESCSIHPTAVIGPPGLKIIQSRTTRERIHAVHVGNIEMGKRVHVGPLSVIHRALFDSTTIVDDVVIGSLCNIGHNVKIGRGSILTTGVQVGGSAEIGSKCFIGMGAIIRNKVRISPKIMVGAGSVVTRHLEKPGMYGGAPARYLQAWDGNWVT